MTQIIVHSPSGRFQKSPAVIPHSRNRVVPNSGNVSVKRYLETGKGTPTPEVTELNTLTPSGEKAQGI
jgi:hypothetical protein